MTKVQAQEPVNKSAASTVLDLLLHSGKRAVIEENSNGCFEPISKDCYQQIEAANYDGLDLDRTRVIVDQEGRMAHCSLGSFIEQSKQFELATKLTTKGVSQIWLNKKIAA